MSIPDEHFQCIKMRARVSYLGMLQDGKSCDQSCDTNGIIINNPVLFLELSFKSGDDILVVGFKQGASKWRPVSQRVSIILLLLFQD